MVKNIDELVEHLNKYKDALIILGPGILEEALIDKEEYNEKYTLKSFKRNKKVFWDYYNNSLKKEMDKKAKKVYASLEKKLSKLSSIIIDQNINGENIDKIYKLHGSIHKYFCPKCKTVYTEEFIKTEREYACECELCGTEIRPSVIFAGEKYNKVEYDKIVDLFNETHTVILIGMDYTEESLLNLIADYGTLKTINAEQKNKEDKVLVSIQNNNEEFDPNEIAFFEFLVKDDIDLALNRLNAKL